jgi:anti-sigma B factor antagonist
MPQTSVLASPRAASRPDASPSFLCTWTADGSRSASVHVEGELHLATAPQLAKTLREAQRAARLVVLDLRELTFIDSWGVDVVLGAVHRARRKGHRLMIVRGPAEVDHVFTQTAASTQIPIFDLDPAEPSPALHLV